jgi:PAS domain S-box-containing protein
MSQPERVPSRRVEPTPAAPPRARALEIEALYDNAPVALCLVDRELRFVRVNRLMALFNGRSVEEHLGRRMEEVLPEAAREQALAIARRVLATGEAELNVEVHTRSPRDPAREHWWLVSCHPVGAKRDPDGLVTVVQNVTALRCAQDVARQQEAELAALYEAAPVGVALVDRELRYVRVNRRLAEMNGLEPEACAGRLVAEVVPEVPGRVLDAARRGLETGEPVEDVEYSIRSRSSPGHARTFLASIAPIRSPDGIRAGVCVIQDVTTLKRAEHLALERLAELEAVKERLGEAQRVAGVGSWEWNIVSDTVWWCESLHALFGKDPRTFVPDSNSFYEMVHPEDRDAIRRQWEATVQRGEPYWVQFRIVLDDGSVRRLRATAILERTPDGLPARLAGTCQLVREADVLAPGAGRSSGGLPVARPGREDA